MSAARTSSATTASPNAPAGRRDDLAQEREAGARARRAATRRLRDLDRDCHQRPCSARMRGSRKRYERSASRLQSTNRIATTSTPPRTIG